MKLWKFECDPTQPRRLGDEIEELARPAKSCWYDRAVLAEDFSTIVRAVAALFWPSAVVVALIVFRKPLRRLIDRIERARVPGLELELGFIASEADRSAATLKRMREQVSTELRGEIDQLERQLRNLSQVASESLSGRPGGLQRMNVGETRMQFDEQGRMYWPFIENSAGVRHYVPILTDEEIRFQRS